MLLLLLRNNGGGPIPPAPVVLSEPARRAKYLAGAGKQARGGVFQILNGYYRPRGQRTE
jgi:hypothetical protein